jgi:hypothetical protein
VHEHLPVPCEPFGQVRRKNGGAVAQDAGPLRVQRDMHSGAPEVG